MAANVRDIFSSHLGFLLSRSGKTQMDMARDLNVATGTVSSWVNGKKFPRADVMERIADYLGVRMTTLIEENGLEVLLQEEDDRRILAAYHAADPSLQAAVRKLLDLPDFEKKGISQSAG